jgi:hypothetical protein
MAGIGPFLTEDEYEVIAEINALHDGILILEALGPLHVATILRRLYAQLGVERAPIFKAVELALQEGN